MIIWYICAAGLEYASPFVVQRIITWLQSDDADTHHGLQLLAILVGTQFLSYVIYQHMLNYRVMLGEKASNTLNSLIYQK
jgi:hypothetical protein